MTVEAEVVVPISAIEHYEYCPRQCALIHVDGVWAENRATAAGTRFHRRVDHAPHRQERGHLTLRSIPLWSEVLGLSGRADAVEVGPGDRVFPVEYKSGIRHRRAADLQLCAQALCLEEMTGVVVNLGAVWYGGPRRRVPVTFDTTLRRTTIAVIEAIRRDVVDGRLPPPPDDERCGACQLEPICLPHTVACAVDVAAYVDMEVLACGT
ncbi:MAG TPA: CRISPR-associated protein Cas4 [Acidimicrobiales bacterium]|nr:CRISPR-associated protein Cas4 [Acidimicrobiales bacterium]